MRGRRGALVAGHPMADTRNGAHDDADAATVPPQVPQISAKEHEMLARHYNPLDAIYDALRLETRMDSAAWVSIERLQGRF